MSNNQNEMSRRFHVSFTIMGNPKPCRYSCTFSDGANHRFPRSPEQAIGEFHRYIQKSRRIPFDSYRITGLTDTYRDSKGEGVEREYSIAGGPNPNLFAPTGPGQETVAMFDDEQIKAESKRAIKARQ